MSDPKQVSPEEAKALLDGGHKYLDVRSEAEFAAGHPAGAYNIPINVPGPTGPTPNPDFAAIAERAFGKDGKLVVGCKSGPRSRRAVALLVDAGFTDLSEMPCGLDGTRDAFGRPLPGWRALGLSVETGLPESRSFSALRGKS
jgi:rhodanese-related sulfurtransferase